MDKPDEFGPERANCSAIWRLSAGLYRLASWQTAVSFGRDLRKDADPFWHGCARLQPVVRSGPEAGRISARREALTDDEFFRDERTHRRRRQSRRIGRR